MSPKNVILMSVLALVPYLSSWAGGDFSGKCLPPIEVVQLYDIVVTRVETDGASGSLKYLGGHSHGDTLGLEPDSAVQMLPMVVFINQRRGRLQDLQGSSIQRLHVSKKECHFNHPVIGEKRLSSHWIVRAKLADGVRK